MDLDVIFERICFLEFATQNTGDKYMHMYFKFVKANHFEIILELLKRSKIIQTAPIHPFPSIL
jgi:hypothetical protein